MFLHLLGDVERAADAELQLDHGVSELAQEEVHPIALLCFIVIVSLFVVSVSLLLLLLLLSFYC